MPAKPVTPAKVSTPSRPTTERNGPRRDVLTTEVLDKAASLFATRGFAATSLQDIANEVGLSRTSMYYYFPSKEALLDALIRGVTQQTTSIFAELEGSPRRSHTERLAQAARQLVMWVTDPHTHFKLLDRSESELPDDLAAMHRDTKRRVLTRMTRMIEDGIQIGEFRALDARVAAFAILGMCNWTAWWFSPVGELDRKEVAEAIAGLAVASVRHPAGMGQVNDLGSLLTSIRGNLDLIEQAGLKLPTRRRRPAD